MSILDTIKKAIFGDEEVSRTPHGKTGTSISPTAHNATPFPPTRATIWPKSCEKMRIADSPKACKARIRRRRAKLGFAEGVQSSDSPKACKARTRHQSSWAEGAYLLYCA